MTDRVSRAGTLFRRSLPFWAALWVVVTVWRPAAGDEAAFQQFVASPDHLSRAAAAALVADTAMPPDCSQRTVGERLSYALALV